MAESVDHSMSCPVCFETMSSPITQCQKGHSVCGDCVHTNSIQHCPLCRSPMTSTRNYQLEDLIVKLKEVTLRAPCKFADRGCKYELRLDEKDSHQLECKSRTYQCEGKTFCNWDCNWTGGYTDILQHFKTSHNTHCWMEFKTEVNMKINLKKNSSDLQVIDFCSGQQLFLYKHKTDVGKKKAYWLFQYVGLKRQAAQYFYEFEVCDGATRKLKTTEICESDCKDANLLFNSEKCVVLSFKTLKNYLNEHGELSIRFRIMRIKKEPVSPPPAAPCSNPMYNRARAREYVCNRNMVPCKKGSVVKNKK